jgi:hypothetical protein
MAVVRSFPSGIEAGDALGKSSGAGTGRIGGNSAGHRYCRQQSPRVAPGHVSFTILLNRVFTASVQE